MSDFRFDLRLAVRSLLRRKAFCAVVIATLALGIGANSAIFSVINAVLLKPLPYRDPGQLALIWSKWSNFDKTWLSAGEYRDYEAQDRLFQSVAAWSDEGDATITGTEGPESVPVARVTANLLDVLGVPVERGRGIAPEEDVPNGPHVVLLGWNLWQQRYAGNPSVVGSSIVVDGESFQVVGILPRQFRLPLEFQTPATAQLIAPLGLERTNPNRGNHGLYGVARLKPGITTAMVSTALGDLTKRWTDEGLYPPTMQFSAFAVSIEQEVNGKIHVALIVLAVAVGLLLLLTCANVANLILMRTDDRHREVAVRAALGAGRGHILRLALTESVLLGLAGGFTGLLLAWGGIRLLAARAPTLLPRLVQAGIDGKVLLFALLLSLVTGLLFGLIPALRSSRLDLANALREGARGQSSGGHRRRGRGLLVVAEMALAVLLVIGAGLTVRSFRNLMAIDPGFDSRNVLTMRLSLSAAKYPDASSASNFWSELRREVLALPGAEQAGLVRVLPIASDIGDAGLAIENHPLPPGTPNLQADWQAVSPGYFETMRIKLIAGRFIDGTDTPDGLQVIVINQTLASEYFPGENPIGQRIRVGGQTRPWRLVVGIVGDYHHNGLTTAVKRAWFIPENQWANSYGNPRLAMSLVVRTRANPGPLAAPIAAIVKRLDPDLPLTQVQSLDAVIGQAVQEQRFTMTLMAGFALLAMILAVVGVYGVISYTVSQRRREIGIRLALGAEPAQVRALVLRQGMAPAAVGIATGLLLALLLSRYLRSLLYDVAPVDPVTFGVVPVVLLVVATGSVFFPAARASRVDPVEALRDE